MKKLTALAMALVLALTAMFVATPNEKASAYMFGTETTTQTHGTCPSCTRSGYTLNVYLMEYVDSEYETTCWDFSHKKQELYGKTWACRVTHWVWKRQVVQECSSCGYRNHYVWYDETTHHTYSPIEDNPEHYVWSGIRG